MNIDIKAISMTGVDRSQKIEEVSNHDLVSLIGDNKFVLDMSEAGNPTILEISMLSENGKTYLVVTAQ